MAWNSEKNRWEGSEEFLYIHEDEQHPGGNSNSARTWTAPASGQVQVEGYAYGWSIDYPNCSDGAWASISRDGLSVWSAPLTPGKIEASFSFLINVESGTRISFVLNKRGAHNWCDLTIFDPTIHYVTASDPQPGSQLKFFGYYHVRYAALDVVRETYGWANTTFSQSAWEFPDATLWLAVKNFGMKVILWAPSLFVLDPSGHGYRLASDYQTTWANFVDTTAVRDRLGQILAINLVDEPFLNGIQCGELEAAANLIKSTLPTIPLFFIEAGEKTQSMCIPTTIDWVGFDLYGTYPRSNAYFQRDLKRMQRKLLPHQKVIYLVDGFYGQGHRRNGLVPADLGPIAQEYYYVASHDPRAIGALAFVWNNDSGDRTVPLAPPLGSKNLPASVLAIHKEIGRKMKR
jgi:hypothetical protein